MRFPDAAWDSIPEFPKAAVRVLSEGFVHSTSKVRGFLPCAAVEGVIGAVLTERQSAYCTQVVQAQHSTDGETSKLLLQLQDGLSVEAVILQYDTSGARAKHILVHRWGCIWFWSTKNCSCCKNNSDGLGLFNIDMGRGGSDADSCVTTGGTRATLCVSSEVGCQMGCTFCATGTMGLKVSQEDRLCQ